MIHGADDVEPEFSAILEASRIAHGVKHPFRNLLSRRNCPPARCRRPLAGFQQLTGINAMPFYALVLFTTFANLPDTGTA
ncbi:unnamed protein product [Urochloa humidicola]